MRRCSIDSPGEATPAAPGPRRAALSPRSPVPSAAWIAACVAAGIVAPGAACGGAAQTAAPPVIPAAETGRHRDEVAAQVQPFLDAQLVSGLVVALYDVGQTEVYGFGRGPGNAPPDGTTLFELGSVTRAYTALLLADAVQRREVEIDTPVAELLPPGVTVPTRGKVAITLGHLVQQSSGLPSVPPTVLARNAAQDPYAKYGDDALYNDLIQTELQATPGTRIQYSSYGTGLLGFALGRKLGGGYAKVLTERVLKPLELKDTFFAVPAAARPRLVAGSNEDLAPVPGWTFDALAGAGGLVTTAQDQLRLIDAELDAAAGGARPLRRAMKLTQEPQLDRVGDNQGMGWTIDSAGRYWSSGSTGGHHAFVGFDPKTKRGIVVLASTATALVDRLVDPLYKVLDGAPPAPVAFPGAAALARYAGHYDLSGAKLQIIAEGVRLYVEGPGEPRRRMSPLSSNEFWIEALQSIAVFEGDGDKAARVVFTVGGRTLAAPRIAAP
jgi:serine-type D-Ala-D-Ala carboxypeptidase/endopeptidase